MSKIQINVTDDSLEYSSPDDHFLSKMIRGCTGRIKIRRKGKVIREIRNVKHNDRMIRGIDKTPKLAPVKVEKKPDPIMVEDKDIKKKAVKKKAVKKKKIAKTKK